MRSSHGAKSQNDTAFTLRSIHLDTTGRPPGCHDSCAFASQVKTITKEETVMFDLNRLLSLRPSHSADMKTNANWNTILNWKLLRGSHEFPGRDGGSCINEAAIVAAGYPYKAVQSIDDCPSTFSRP